MSRSYKKQPVIKDNGSSKKTQKNIANRKIRAQQRQGIEVGDGGSFKKHFEQYDIADYICRWTKKQAIAYYNKEHVRGGNWARENFATLEDFLKYWEKRMLKK